MADGISIEVKGIPELDALFAELVGPVADRAMLDGVTEGAKVFQAAISEAARMREDTPAGNALPPGKLKSSIQIRLSKLRSGKFAAFVEPSKETRHVARFLETGHRIVKGGRSKKAKGGGFSGPGREVGFVKAYPFVRPSFEAVEETAIDAVKETILSELTEEAQNLGLR